MNENDISRGNHAIETGAAAVPPMLKRAGEQAGKLAQRGLDAIDESTQSLRDKARLARESTSGYVQNEPVKALLIAGAIGAALMGLMSLLARNDRTR
jgi:ElaB/YqjD/DUF883 family membrane-anchored ribosome-binding protein